VALPPLRPAAFFCAVVPPWEDDERDELEPDFLTPRLEAPGPGVVAFACDVGLREEPDRAAVLLTTGSRRTWWCPGRAV
jgi:hypothetical protein